MFKSSSRYDVVGSILKGSKGTLVDIGARDAILKKYLPPSLQYLSADMVPGHDLLWNLEKPIESPDSAYDFVVALDVLEHVENIHGALKELIRISRDRVFISLPNMSCLPFRINFLRHGFLSNKYSLLPAHQGDRHRWLTVYPEMVAFIESVAGKECGCKVRKFDLLQGYTRIEKISARLPLPASLRAYLVLFEISKPAR